MTPLADTVSWSSFFGIPVAWLVQDLVVLVATVFVLRFAMRREARPGQTLLEFFAFCFLYAGLFENGAVLAGFYGYGRSLLMFGYVPFAVPALEFIVLYGALLMLEKLQVPTWTKPFLVGFWGMLQDFTLDPLAGRQVYLSEGRAIGRWTWFLREGDANLFGIPVFNFPGWVLILGLGSACLLLGRWWFERSGYRPWVGVAYPFLCLFGALVPLVLPTSQFILWLAPFFTKGSVGEWIMLGVHVVVPLALLAFVWRGRMKAAFTLRDDWPVLVLPALFHGMDLAFAVGGGHFELLGLELAVTAFHVGLVAFIWTRAPVTHDAAPRVRATGPLPEPRLV